MSASTAMRSKRQTTLITREWPLATVCTHVIGKVRFLRECTLARITLIRLLARVNTLVYRARFLVAECARTKLTFITFLLMRTFMLKIFFYS